MTEQKTRKRKSDFDKALAWACNLILQRRALRRRDQMGRYGRAATRSRADLIMLLAGLVGNRANVLA